LATSVIRRSIIPPTQAPADHGAIAGVALRALDQAVRSLTSYYNAAVQAGHEPNETWLKPRPVDPF
jgi:hypothetical protein